MNKAILLSGGVGTRLSSDIPKQNIKVEDRMKAYVLHGPNDYRYEDVTVKQPGEGEVLIAVKADAFFECVGRNETVAQAVDYIKIMMEIM